MYRTDCVTAHPVLPNQLSKVNTSCSLALQIYIYYWELKAAGFRLYLCLTLELLWPSQNAALDSLRTLSWFVSYRRLLPQFQFSLSAVTLVYLSQWDGHWKLTCKPPLRAENNISESKDERAQKTFHESWQTCTIMLSCLQIELSTVYFTFKTTFMGHPGRT